MNDEPKVTEEACSRVLAASHWAASTTSLEAIGLLFIVWIPILALMQLCDAGTLLAIGAGVVPPALIFVVLLAIGLRQES